MMARHGSHFSWRICIRWRVMGVTSVDAYMYTMAYHGSHFNWRIYVYDMAYLRAAHRDGVSLGMLSKKLFPAQNCCCIWRLSISYLFTFTLKSRTILYTIANTNVYWISNWQIIHIYVKYFVRYRYIVLTTCEDYISYFSSCCKYFLFILDFL